MAELRATGQTKPRAGYNVLNRLTSREFEIVSLTASGLTTSRSLERLFSDSPNRRWSPPAALPKLGVSTRAFLRDALASLSSEVSTEDLKKKVSLWPVVRSHRWWKPPTRGVVGASRRLTMNSGSARRRVTRAPMVPGRLHLDTVRVTL